jgi:hypothetical protein
MMEAGSRAVLPTPLRRQKHLTLACDEGWLGARWLDHNRYYLLVTLTDSSGDPEQTRAAMKQAAPGLYEWLMPDNG